MKQWGRGWILVFVLIAATAVAGPVDNARKAYEDYESAIAAAERASSQRQVQQAQELRDKALDALRDAQAILKTAGIHHQPGHKDYLFYVDILEAKGDFDLAAEALERWVKENPEDAQAWRRLAKNRLDAGPATHDAAYDALQTARELAPNDPESAYLFGRFYWTRGLYDLARESFKNAYERNPQHVPAQIALAATEARVGEIQSASERLDSLGQQAQPYDIETRVMLRCALADFDLHRRQIEDTHDAHRAYARLLYRAGRFSDALLAARRATTIEPEDFETWNFLAAIQQQIGNLQQAIGAYEASLEANPDQPDIKTALERLQQAQQQRNEAMENQRQQTGEGTP